MADQHETERLTSLLAAGETHCAFLEGALGLAITPLFEDEDMVRPMRKGAPIEMMACRLMCPARSADSGSMDDSMGFAHREQMVGFLAQVVLLFGVARAPQRAA